MKRRYLLSFISAALIFLAVATANNKLSPANKPAAVGATIQKITQGVLQAIGRPGQGPLVAKRSGLNRGMMFGVNVVTQITGENRGEAQAFDICYMSIWGHMSRVTIIVFLSLLVMSIWSIVIMVERYMTFSAAMNQSREFAPKVASTLMRQEIDEAINLSDKYSKSHLAMVVSAGLKEFRARQLSGDISGAVVDASKRALQRATTIKILEFRRGLSSLATIGSIALFVGLFGTLFGFMDTFEGMAELASAGISAVAGGIAESLTTTAFGLGVAVPAAWLFKYFNAKVDKFAVEMDVSSAELIDLLLKQQRRK